MYTNNITEKYQMVEINVMLFFFFSARIESGKSIFVQANQIKAKVDAFISSLCKGKS